MTPTDPQPRRGSNFLSGLLGGFVVLAVGGGLIATGVLGEDEGDNPKEPSVAQSINRPVDDGGSDSARSVSDIYRDEGQGVVFVRSQGVSSSGERRVARSASPTAAAARPPDRGSWSTARATS